MNCERQRAMLKKVQEMEFVAIELNLYLDTHPCDAEALNDYNCAVEALHKAMRKYEKEFGPLLNFGMSDCDEKEWRWVENPWPWEL